MSRGKLGDKTLQPSHDASRRRRGVSADGGLAFIFAAAALAVVLAVMSGPKIGEVWAAGLALVVVAILAYSTHRLAVAPTRAENAEAAARGLVARIAEGSPEGQLIVDGQSQVVYANEAYRQLVDAPEGVTPSLTALFAMDELALDRLGRLEMAARAGNHGRDEIGLVGRDGRKRWLSLSAFALPSSPMHVAWHIADTTLWQEMQEAIGMEQSKLADFIDNAPVGFYSVDQDGRFLFVNQTLAGWLGNAPEEFTGGGHRLADVLAEDEAVLAELLPTAVGAGLFDRDVRLKDRDGGLRSVRITQSVVVDPAGGRLHTRSVVRDLTQEVAWREALRQAEEHFRRFFDFAPIGILVVDRDGTILESNAAFRKLAGEQKAASLWDLVRADDRGELDRRIAALVEGAHEAAPLEVRFKSGAERVAQLYAGRLDSGTGGAATFLLHLIDTSDQKKLEMQFAQSQKMQAVGQLAGGIAHDFNNLLTAMIGFCDLLLLRHQPGDQSFADIMQIKQNANRAAGLVRQLLAFSRQQTLRPKVLDVTDVLADLRNLLGRLLGETVELKMIHGRDLGPVKVDQGQFEQVVINLAVNARDAMAQGGTLTIRTANVTAEESTQLGHDLMPLGEYVLIEVIDTGTGIPPAILGKIFEPFFTTKAVGAGTGLGLSTVYGIIKQTGGFIFPESRPGQGSTFRIYLPRYRPAEGEAVMREEASGAVNRDLTGKGTLLLVEDEDAVRMFAARALRNKGYTVLEANSGSAALQLAADHAAPIDLLISDVVMPNMDGPTLAQRIRQDRPELKIIFISGYAEDAFRRTPDAPSDTSFLPKPFSLSQLAGKVKEVLT